MQSETLGESGESVNDGLHQRRIHGRARAGAGDGLLLVVGDLLQLPLFAALDGLFVGPVVDVLHLLANAPGPFLGDHALAQQALGVDVADRLPALDFAVHQRLRVARVVAFVVAVLAIADHVDDDVLLELLAVVEGDLDGADAGLGVVAVGVQNGRLDHARDVGAIGRGAALLGRGGEAQLVIDHQVHGAAGSEAFQQREVERLGHDTLAGEGRVAVHEHRQHLIVSEVAHAGLLGAHDAFHHRVDGLEVARIRGERNLDFAAATGALDAARAEMVLHVAGALRGLGIDVALELAEDLGRRFADEIRQHGEPAAVRHADHHLAHALVGGALHQLVENDHRRLAALQREAFLPDEARVQEVLEALGLQQPHQHALLQLARKRPEVGQRLHPLLQPALFLGMLDVHILAAQPPAVGLAQRVEDHSKRRDSRASGQRAGDKIALQIPDSQAVGGGVELGVILRRGAQRIEVGDQVAAHAVGVDQLQHRGLLGDLVQAFIVAEAGERGAAVALPFHGLVGHAEFEEDLFVEPFLTLEQRLQPAQESARLRALDDAVVVGAGQGHDLGDAELRAQSVARALKLRRVVDGAGGNDRALPGHQPRDAGAGAHGAGIGQRNRGSLEVVRPELARPRAGHQIVERSQKLAEAQRAGVLDIGHHQAAMAVLAGDVHGDAEVDLTAHHAMRRAAELGVGVVDARQSFQGAHDGPGRKMRVADLRFAMQLAHLVQQTAILVDHFHRDGALRSGRRDSQAEDHVLGDAQRRALQRHKLIGGAQGEGWRRRCGGRR